ncbi:hypothetical protein ACFL9U_16925 [Thermodesulfobacteriota bacterium]
MKEIFSIDGIDFSGAQDAAGIYGMIVKSSTLNGRSIPATVIELVL